MKKRLLSIALLLTVVLTFVGCKNNSNTDSTSNEYKLQATIELIEDGESFKKETLSFNEGEKLLDVMKRNLELEEKDGFITSIDGHTQDEDSNKYWLYTVNGEMAEVGANQFELRDKDEVVFTLEELKNE
ncbi:DUF4430 domain-containing protein [Lagierella massiliensis]|uniref:DUF4430 domain-containing protein n=1 Tax=Lagierella massiliensis TaxID=1689303 RepID=UPI0006D7B9D4|nr:DUF4430 domain-containing protein [Lagierella massiliensis]